MSKYTANIRQQGDRFYALVVRNDRNGEQQLDCSYRGRFFASRKAAEKSTAAHITKVAA